jgi:hypothetical protein
MVSARESRRARRTSSLRVCVLPQIDTHGRQLST